MQSLTMFSSFSLIPAWVGWLSEVCFIGCGALIAAKFCKKQVSVISKNTKKQLISILKSKMEITDHLRR